jgi:hypothetical protein
MSSTTRLSKSGLTRHIPQIKEAGLFNQRISELHVAYRPARAEVVHAFAYR